LILESLSVLPERIKQTQFSCERLDDVQRSVFDIGWVICNVGFD
jgi:hypothetical protein